MFKSRRLACRTGGFRGSTVPHRRLVSRIPLTTYRVAPSIRAEDEGPLMANIDEELGQMERDIRQLKIEYDQYFGGGRKRPPTEIEWRIELLVKRYGERGGELKIGQRFRFNNLTQTYAKYKDIFRKKSALKEEGRLQRHFGAAAKAIEAERAKAHLEPHAEAVASAPTGAHVPSRPPAPADVAAFRVVCADPERETENVERLY